ncbi:MAG: DNA-binding transcriptional regulator [Myxococcaceae bacterium]|nr:DNA-binding transcriptional regulator [Myxococcaceae bacterium]MBH2006566.1 DNA-binding transcriptional regulator [Myxococcaceae bacterium]
MNMTITEVIHQSVKGLYDIDLVDSKTMRTFDVMCLPAIRDLSPTEIKQIRIKEKLSQPVFAKYLNASASTVKKWETGEKHPAGPALKLLNIVAAKGLEALL